jgi:hypothetical protein
MIEHVAGVVLAATLHTSSAPQPFWKRVSAHYQDNRYEKFRRCVSKRESENIPTVVSHDGHYAQGLYQFEPRWWDTYLRTRLRLASTPYTHKPIHLWPASVQTAAFWLVLDHGKNWTAWAGGRYDCTRYLP